MVVELRDRFGNLCDLDDEKDFDASQDFSVDITELISEQKIDSCYYWQRDPSEKSRVQLTFVFVFSGLYRALVSYRGLLLKNGDFNIVCLTSEENDKVEKFKESKKSYSFSARLLSNNAQILDDSKAAKGKAVEIGISTKQLTIKEYIFRFFPKRVATFRVSPSTKFYFNRRYAAISRSPSDLLSSLSSSDSKLSELTAASCGSSTYSDGSAADDRLLVIDDGSQQLELTCRDRNLIVALFTHHLLSRIGGSETFKDKQNFFYSEIRRYHAKSVYGLRSHIKVEREQMFEQSMKLLKWYSPSDWCRRFEIEFIGENGLDWGGLLAEWLELICRNLFDPDAAASPDRALFVRFKNDSQGLVHPNAKTTMPLSYYELAGKIIGKTLVDAALTHNSRYYVSARFSRSFLAQLIGLRINHRYFEHDDPDLYVSKVKYILENNITNMEEFCFVEEEYDEATGRLVCSHELIPNGANVKVTEENKLRYLDMLAQHRLRAGVKDQVAAVLKGLNELIPDNLLSIFDENELELLVCGATDYSVSDLKMNHVVIGSSYDFLKVLDWFWKALASFSDEEFARLLQFVTGSSRLPPGGFAELSPRFTITTSLMRPGTLPLAHTCFNQICLPDYDTFEDFERSLRIAITEGNEGFGLV